MGRQRRRFDFSFGFSLAGNGGEFRSSNVHTGRGPDKDNRPDEIDELAQPGSCPELDVRIFRENAFEALVVTFDRDHRVIDKLSNV